MCFSLWVEASIKGGTSQGDSSMTISENRLWIGGLVGQARGSRLPRSLLWKDQEITPLPPLDLRIEHTKIWSGKLL